MMTPITSTRTVEVPVDYGPMPPGWSSLTAAQKRWALSEAKDRRHPVWAVLDEGVPTNDACLRDEAEDAAADRLGNRLIAAIFVAMLGACGLGVYYVAKPVCWWPVTSALSWECPR